MNTDPENTGRDQAGRFAPGNSGNLSGKPPDTRHRATRMAEKLMAGDTEPVVLRGRGEMRSAKAMAGNSEGSVLDEMTRAGETFPAGDERQPQRRPQDRRRGPRPRAPAHSGRNR